MSKSTIEKQVTVSYMATRPVVNNGFNTNSIFKSFETEDQARAWLDQPLQYRFLWQYDEYHSYEEMMDRYFENDADRREYERKVHSGVYQSFMLSFEVQAGNGDWETIDSLCGIVGDGSKSMRENYQADMTPEELRNVEIEVCYE